MKDFAWSDIEFGPKRYHALMGIARSVALGLLVTTALLTFTLMINGWPRYLFAVAGVWSGLFTVNLFRMRLRKPWCKHHYPLFRMWGFSLGLVAGVQAGTRNLQGQKTEMPRFEAIAPIFLRIAFPNIEACAIDLLVSRAQWSLWDVMLNTGGVNLEKRTSEPALFNAYKEQVMKWQNDNPDFVKLRVLVALIIGGHEGARQASDYLVATLLGDAQ